MRLPVFCSSVAKLGRNSHGQWLMKYQPNNTFVHIHCVQMVYHLLCAKHCKLIKLWILNKLTTFHWNSFTKSLWGKWIFEYTSETAVKTQGNPACCQDHVVACFCLTEYFKNFLLDWNFWRQISNDNWVVATWPVVSPAVCCFVLKNFS